MLNTQDRTVVLTGASTGSGMHGLLERSVLVSIEGRARRTEELSQKENRQ